MALISPAQFREHYPALVGTNEDAVIDTLITRADGILATYCGYPVPDAGVRTLEAVTYTVYPDAPSYLDDRALLLPVRPVDSITSVHVDPDWAYGVETEVLPADRADDLSGGIIWLPRSSTVRWSSEPRANQVVLVAGYAVTPPDLVALTAATVRHLWDLRRVQGQASMQIVSDQVTYSDPNVLIPESVRTQLGPYVLWESRAA